tara:strand:+ start:295 stop:492 length:198 start_codon:yes stop_codon:yes gene_type:complete
MRVFLNLILAISRRIINNNNIKKSQVKIPFNDKFSKDLISFNLFPIKTVTKVIGVNPIIVENINL